MLRMHGRDPHEAHRVSTPLELLFDLTFVISFGFAASQLAHALTEGHIAAGLLGFGFASFAICWAWTNFTWFASAYDTDDWLFRLMTMAQMTGVLVLAIGLPRMFASFDNEDGRIDNSIIVLGYVIMRIAMMLQWLRAARQDPQRRRTCLTYAAIILIAQLGWVGQLLIPLPMHLSMAIICLLVMFELAGPMLAERVDGGTPWHAHHIAERYGLFAIIALGEGLVGTVAALSAVVDTQGWTLEVLLVAVAGVGLTFGIWWLYQLLPSADMLHGPGRRTFAWAFLQMMTCSTIVAMGAGLHLSAYTLEQKTHITAFTSFLITATIVGILLALLYALHYFLVRKLDRLHLGLLLITAAIFAAAILAASAGVGMPLCLCILALAPVVSIIGYEWKGHRRQS